jgi:hypothetical protein
MTQPTTNKPTHIAWHVTERNGQSYWTRIGVAWQHKDGNGFNVEIALMPRDGKLALRVATDKREAGSGNADAAPAEPIQL